MFRTSPRAGLAAGIAALAAAACSDATGPASVDFDPQATAAAVQRVMPDRQQNGDLYGNLDLVSGKLSDASASAAVASGLPRVLTLFRGEGATRAISPAALAELEAAGASDGGTREISLSLLLPETLLGSTLVWNPETGAYEVDPGRSDAPPAGVRFVMYEVDPETRTPALPLTEIGYVDLIDESTDESSLRLRVRAVDTSGSEPVPLLDYVIGGEVVLSGETRLTATAEGFVSDGTERLDFVLSQEIVLSSDANTATGTTRYELSAPSEGITVVLDTEGTFDLASGEPTSFSLALTVDDGESRVVLDAAVDGDRAIDGTVALDGRTVVVISGTTAEPAFTRPDGTELTQEEKEALRELVGAIEEILDFAASVFGLFQAA